MSTEPVRNADELEDADLRQRLREFCELAESTETEEHVFELTEKDLLLLVKSELEGAREKAAEGAAPEFAEFERLARKYADWAHSDRELFLVLLSELDRRADVIAAQAAELERLRADLATSQQISRDMIEAASVLRVAEPAQAEPQDQGPYDGLTSTATACHNCPTKLSPEWRVRTRRADGVPEYSLVCCMCGRATEWTTNWRGLVEWWCTNNPALPDGTKVPR